MTLEQRIVQISEQNLLQSLAPYENVAGVHQVAGEGSQTRGDAGFMADEHVVVLVWFAVVEKVGDTFAVVVRKTQRVLDRSPGYDG